MAQKRLLLLNGSHSEIPLIEAAKQLDFTVITTGYDPTMIGHRLADDYHECDFSDLEAIHTLARKLQIDAICSCANDFGAITAAYVGERMGLPGHDPYETSLDLHHKDRFKSLTARLSLPTPAATSFDSKTAAREAIRRIRFPVIVKPIDLTGGKGITIVRTESDYTPAIEHAFSISRAKRIVAEEFFEGTQHSFSTFIRDSRVIFSFSDNEFSYRNRYLVSTSAAPATNIGLYRDGLIQAAEDLACTLHLVDGVLHFQYLADDRSFTILEPTRRCSGDLYPYPVDYACNIQWARWIVMAETGMDLGGFPQTMQSGYYGRHCIMAPANGVVRGVRVSDEIHSNILREVTWWKAGDRIDNYLVQKLGVVMLGYASMQEMLDKTGRINELITVEMQ